PDPDDLERRRAAFEARFREGWVPLPPSSERARTTFIQGVSDDAEVIITGAGPARSLAILFTHQAYPDVRFGHRFARWDDKHSLIWLMEEIETGALHRMMRDAPPAAGAAGITWTTFKA
ncbi:MAG: hypothetical protein ACYCPF_08325, partial [Streptosporangiaceae bacterium]